MSKKIIKSLSVAFILIAFASSAIAQTKVVVIPMSGDDLKPLANIVSVAKQNGDFSSPIAAVASITDASESNPYLIAIAPGVYDLENQQLVMKEYVDIVGSGQNVTTLEGSVGSAGGLVAASSLVVGASNSSMQSLTIHNSDSGFGMTTGLYCSVDSAHFKHLTIKVSDAINQVGLAVGIGGDVQLTDSMITVSGGTGLQIAVSNEAEITISDSHLEASNGTGNQIALFSSNEAVVSDVSINVNTELATATSQIGVASGGSGIVLLSNADIQVDAENATGIRSGVRNTTSDARAIIRSSIINSPLDSVDANTGSGDSETFIVSSFLIGNISGDPRCAATHSIDGGTGVGVLLDPTCSPPTPAD